MATLAQATFEGGTNGAVLAPEGGWAVAGDGGRYDTSVANQGSVSAKFTNATYGDCRHTLATTGNPWRLRMYVRRGAQAQTTHPFLVDLQQSGTTYVADLQLRNELGGRYRLRWNYTTLQQASAPAPIEQWQRIDLLYRGPNVPLNGLTAILFDPADDTSVQEVLQGASAAAQIDTIRFGPTVNRDMDYWFDDVLLTDSLDDPGPAGGGGGGGGGLKVGGQDVSALHAGGQSVGRAYLGSTLIYGSAP